MLDDWQRWTIDGILSEDKDHRLCAAQSLLLVPRQNGKGAVLEVVELFAFFVLDWASLVHSAHNQTTSSDHFNRLTTVIEGNPELAAITEVHKAVGREYFIRTDNAARLRFSTRTAKIGRGPSPKLVVLDEALFLQPAQLAALLPSMAAQTMSGDVPILIYASSAPVPSSESLHHIRNACKSGAAPDAFYAEWGCAVGTATSDREAWYEANPALGIRIAESWLESTELVNLTPEEFATERLGVVLGADSTTELPGWAGCADPDSVHVGRPAISVDVSQDLAWCSIAVAGIRADRLAHVEVVAHLHGTGEAVAILSSMAKEPGASITLDGKSAAGGLIPALVRAGVKVIEVSTADAVQACAQLSHSVATGQIRHRDQGPLNAAVSGAGVRSVGDGWCWARKSSSVDISPLVAVTLAAWSLSSVKPRKPTYAF